MTINYTSNTNYSNHDYSTILNYFLSCGIDTFEFVIRSDIDFKSDYTYKYDDTAYELIKELIPYLIETNVSNTWISGSSYESPARIYHYHFNSNSLDILLKYTNKFSDWKGPSCPDDLSLIKNKKEILSIIGHEILSIWNIKYEQYKYLYEHISILELID